MHDPRVFVLNQAEHCLTHKPNSDPKGASTAGILQIRLPADTEYCEADGAMCLFCDMLALPLGHSIPLFHASAQSACQALLLS